MTLPMLPGMQPQGPPRDASGYTQLPGGYDTAVQQANRGQPPQYQPQVQTQLGQMTPQAMGNQQPMFQETQSPLAGLPPRVSGVPDQLRQQVPQQVPQQQPTQQQPLQPTQPQYQAPQGVDLNQRLAGQNVPPELQGRSVGELVGMLNGLRQVHLASMTQQPTQQAAPTQQQVPQQQPGGQQNALPAFDWKNPNAAVGQVVDDRIDRAINERLLPALAPVLQQSQLTAATAARNAAASEVGASFAQIEPLVLQRLQGMAPQHLQNPETWRIATRAVLGDLMIQGAQRQQAQQNVPQQAGLYMGQPQQNPAPNLNGFFAEQPMQGGPVNSNVQLTQQQARAAELMGMPLADYAAWAIGVPVGGRR